MKLNRSKLNKRVGKRARLLRSISGMPQYQVANEIGVCPTTYSRFESGQASLGMDYTKPLADSLGVEIDELFSETVTIILE